MSGSVDTIPVRGVLLSSLLSKLSAESVSSSVPLLVPSSMLPAALWCDAGTYSVEARRSAARSAAKSASLQFNSK